MTPNYARQPCINHLAKLLLSGLLHLSYGFEVSQQGLCGVHPHTRDLGELRTKCILAPAIAVMGNTEPVCLITHVLDDAQGL
jgi:hypothetical protein